MTMTFSKCGESIRGQANAFGTAETEATFSYPKVYAVNCLPIELDARDIFTAVLVTSSDGRGYPHPPAAIHEMFAELQSGSVH